MSEYILTTRRWCVYLLIVGLGIFGLEPGAKAQVSIGDLRCEQRVNPLGIDTVKPRFSWKLSAKERAQFQYAYQILVASSPAKLVEGEADLWDSGQVVSSQSILVPYAGKELVSHQKCFWRVRVWSDEKKVSGWTKPAEWSMGILSTNEWRGKWIGWDEEDAPLVLTDTSWIWYPEGDATTAVPPGTNWFRKEVTLPLNRVIKRATFEFTGDNECRSWLDEFDLGARNNHKSVRWYDLATRLESGRTYVFGFVGRNTGTNDSPAGIVGKLTIEFDRGEPMVVRTDDSWKVSREFQPGWNRVGFDDSGWVAAKVSGPVGIQPWDEVKTAEDRRFPARWLRKEFALEKKIRRATVYYSGLGSSELYLNGKKVGDAVLSPAVSQYNKRAYYVTHDVTAEVERGLNAIGIVLAGGRFASDRSKVYSGTVNSGWPKLMLHLRVEHTDGSVTEVVSDESWKLSTMGPIRSSGEYDGEEYDARMELRGWDKPHYKGHAWQPVKVVAAPGALAAQMIDPIRVTQNIRPISYKEVRPGVLIYDMGQNMVGWVRLRVRGSAGHEVRLRFAETLNPDGTLYMANLRGAKVTDTYTLRGVGREVWEPRFTYHGFRYVEVTGLPGYATLAAIEGRVVHDDVERAGEFACSNPLLNQIYSNVDWGTRGNYRSMPTDCPQRDERQGWLGDRSEECRGETYLFNISKLYPKWMQDIVDAQRESGSLPDVAPAFWPIYSDNVTWPSTLIIAPGILYRQYGDMAPIEASYDASKRWLEYMNRFMTNGIIARDSYGDWCVPPEDPKLIHSKDPARQTDKALLATAYFYNNLKLMERYAKLLGKKDDVARFGQWAAEIKVAFNQKFLKTDKGYYDNGSQTSCVLPLAFGLVPNEMRPRVFGQLVKKISSETKGHIGTGLIGGQYLCRVLSDNGRTDLAYKMATKREYPSWGYMIDNGATTIWELWNGNTADPTMNSGNHVMLVGDLIIWLNEYLAGIAADPNEPGFKRAILKPHPVGDLTFARARHESPYGTISSDWTRELDPQRNTTKFVWNVEIPPNTTATAYVPSLRLKNITESGNSLGRAAGVKLLRSEGDRILLQLTSGKFKLVSE